MGSTAAPGFDERRSPGAAWLRSFVTLVAGETSTGVLRFLALVWVARAVGPDGFGAVGAGVGLAGLLVSANSGLSSFGTRAIAADPEASSTIVGRLVTARVAVAVAAYVVTGAVVLAVDGLREDRTVLLLYALAVFTDAVNLRWAFVGLLRTGWVAVATPVAAVPYVVATVVLVHDAGDVSLVPLPFLAGEVVLAGVLLVASLQQFGAWRPSFERRSWGAGIRDSMDMTVTKAARHVLLTVDTLIVSALVSSAAAGRYAAAQRLTLVAMALVGLFYETALPAFVRAYQRSAADGERLVRATLRRSFAVVVPLAAVGTLLAGPIVSLVIGDEYDGSTNLLRVLAWGIVLNTLGGPFNMALWALGHHRAVTVVTVAAAVVNLVLNVALLPALGAMGAAIADVAAKGLLLVLLAVAMQRCRRSAAAPTREDALDLVTLAGEEA